MFRRLCVWHDGLPADSVPQILGCGILGDSGELQRPWICMEVCYCVWVHVALRFILD